MCERFSLNLHVSILSHVLYYYTSETNCLNRLSGVGKSPRTFSAMNLGSTPRNPVDRQVIGDAEGCTVLHVAELEFMKQRTSFYKHPLINFKLRVLNLLMRGIKRNLFHRG